MHTVLRRLVTKTIALACAVPLLAGCSTPKGDTAAEKRASVLEMRDEVIAKACAQEPALRAKLDKAAGYGVFTNTGAKILLLATGHGYGLVHDNRSGDEIFMRMLEVGGGLGIGIKKFRAVFVFHTREAFDRFISSGWEFGGDADAAAKADDETGGALGVQATSGELAGLEVYQFTDAGLALSATIAGTKYDRDDELNGN